jgi:predicted secreted Zn-dependent protease
MTGLCVALLLFQGSMGLASDHDAGRAPLEIVESELRVDVDAADLRTLRQLLKDPTSLDGHPAKGATRSVLEVRSTLVQGPEGCVLSGLTMVVQITRVLPSLRTPRGVGVKLTSDEWKQAVQRLEEHEDGHRRHALAAARKLHAQLLAVPRQAQCSAMQRLLARHIRMARVRLELKDDFYDQRTQHGTRGVADKRSGRDRWPERGLFQRQ